MKHKIAFIITLFIIPGLLLCANNSATPAHPLSGPPMKTQFNPVVGVWHLEKSETNTVYAVDGRNWEKGLFADGVVENAKRMYGSRYAEFLDNLEAYKYFPLSIYGEVSNFTGGIITVRFKTISGRIDQAAGIAFNIQENGDYLVIRANPLENNIVLFKMEKGVRSSVQWIRNVPVPSKTWHTLSVAIHGNTVTGLLNGKKYIQYTHPKKISGRVGLWSKADSYVVFDRFVVEKK